MCFLGIVDVISDTIVLVGMLVLLAAAEPVVTFVALMVLVAAAGLFWRTSHPYFVRWGERSNRVAAEMYRAVTEPLVGIKTVKVMEREGFFAELYRQRIAAYVAVARVNTVMQQIPRHVIEVMMAAGLLGAIVLAAVNGRSPADLLPTLALFAAAAYRIMPAVVRITSSVQNFRFASAALDTVFADVVRFRTGEPLVPAASDRVVAKLRQQLSLHGIVFTYEGAAGVALNGVDLVLRRGEAIAITGGSGAGKTTLVDIMLGLHGPDKGVIAVDGEACRDSVRHRLFGYVPQDPFLIDDTIRRNVALGLEDGAINDARLWCALKAAALADFIASLPDGLDTIVGERGIRLSGGQRQRLGVARALYDDPDVLVLDEATSSLDSVTEAEIMAAVQSLRGAKTLVIVAHRLSTIRCCDRIYYLEQGRIAASGTFDDLNVNAPGFRAMARQMGLVDHPAAASHHAVG
jgi:ATP-binding cassette subfamily C protein